MTYDYQYTREILTSGNFEGLYDINNPNRVGGGGEQIWLADEVKTAIPGKAFKLTCDNGTATFKFDVELTAGEETTLNNTVAAHKNNT